MSKKYKSEEDTREQFFNAVKKSNIPLLTLDKGWHDLFYEGKPKEIERLEKELNDAIKSQGKINSEKEELNNLKQTLLKQIMDNMDAGENSRASKKIEKSKELIGDINDKLILLEDKQLDAPDIIRTANAKLLMAGMDELCRKNIETKKEIEELEMLIENARIELKKKILLRQQKIEDVERIDKYLTKTVGKDFVMKYEEYLK